MFVCKKLVCQYSAWTVLKQYIKNLTLLINKYHKVFVVYFFGAACILIFFHVNVLFMKLSYVFKVCLNLFKIQFMFKHLRRKG